MCNLFIRDESCQLLLDSEAFLSCEGQPLVPEDDLAEDMEKMVKIEEDSKVKSWCGLLFFHSLILWKILVYVHDIIFLHVQNGEKNCTKKVIFIVFSINYFK